ncbi:MAG: hypothetical protein OJF62_000853 [Pseudolabrys sp.]|jgi:hypothetical protein|nr:hypothetical protein [Pseudolabrys sp.]
MTEQSIRSNVRPFAVSAAMPWLVGAGVYLLLLALAPKLLNDPDTYWHVTVGRWILAHGTVPTADPFSFTMHDRHWITFEWLSEVAYAAALTVAGWRGVAILAAAAIALAFGLLARFLMRRLPPVAVLLLIVASLAILAPHLLARPHVLVLPVMVAWASALVDRMDRRAGPPYAALPLLVLWANLHGSVIVGLGLIGPAVIEALLDPQRQGKHWRIVRQWTLFAGLAVAAACITPYGAGPLLAPLKTLGLGHALQTIMEWRPQDFSRPGAFELVLLLGIFALSRGVRLPPVRALVLIGLLHFALAQTRNADLLAMLAPFYLAAPLALQFKPRNPADGAPRAPAHIVGLGIAAVAACATIVALRQPIAPDARITPQAAVQAAGLAHAGPVLNDYAFGGYLIYAGIAPFIDGRGELYGGQFIERQSRAVSLANLPDFLKLLDQYHIEATLLTPETPAVALLDRLPGWQRVYSDGVAVVHKRRMAAPRDGG